MLNKLLFYSLCCVFRAPSDSIENGLILEQYQLSYNMYAMTVQHQSTTCDTSRQRTTKDIVDRQLQVCVENQRSQSWLFSCQLPITYGLEILPFDLTCDLFRFT